MAVELSLYVGIFFCVCVDFLLICLILFFNFLCEFLMAVELSFYVGIFCVSVGFQLRISSKFFFVVV